MSKSETPRCFPAAVVADVIGGKDLRMNLLLWLMNYQYDGLKFTFHTISVVVEKAI
jgi:hypothetical protein